MRNFLCAFGLLMAIAAVVFGMASSAVVVSGSGRVGGFAVEGYGTAGAGLGVGAGLCLLAAALAHAVDRLAPGARAEPLSWATDSSHGPPT